MQQVFLELETLIKQVYQKGFTKKFNSNKYQSMYFTSELTKIQEKLSKMKKKAD